MTCKGGHRSKRYQRLWARRGKPRLLASFHQSFWLFFQQGRPTARTCSVRVETQTASLASACAHVLHIRSWSEWFFSYYLPIVSNRLMGRYDEGSAGSLLRLRMEMTRACFHTVGKWWVRRSVLNISARRDTAHWGRCFKNLFGIPFCAWSLADFKILDGFLNLVRVD